MKRYKRSLSLLLAICMLFGLTVQAAAAPVVEASATLDSVYVTSSVQRDTSKDPLYKIAFIDCGRKFYSVKNLQAYIDAAAEAGFNYVQLGVGNDGLRFMLDDMSLTTTTGATYDSDAVTKGISKGNADYLKRRAASGQSLTEAETSKQELTQAEMDGLIAYAKSKGISIIPLLNTPGHMDAIITCMKQCGIVSPAYGTSIRTVDVRNTEAVAFTQALVAKYAAYFAGKGCTLFNMGADEYANDAYSNGFSYLVSRGEYSYYVKYVNSISAIIRNAGMTPMAFNDGLYYDGQDVEFDKNILVSYWSSGWSGYNVASAATISAKHRMVNTNGDYYWVVGKSDAQCSVSKAQSFDINTFMGSSTKLDAAGAMFCLWSDYPLDATMTGDDIIAAVTPVVKAFGGALPVVETQTPVEIVGEDGAAVTNLTVGSSVKLALGTGVSATWSSSDEKVIALSADSGANLRTAATAITGESVLATAVGSGTATISAVLENGTTITGAPITVADPQRSVETIELTMGGASVTRTQSGVNNENNVDMTGYDAGIALVQVVGQDAGTAADVYEAANPTVNQVLSQDSTSWQETGYWYKVGTGYERLYAKRGSSSNYVLYSYAYGTNQDGIGNQWVKKSSLTSTTINITVYTRTQGSATPASTEITFTPVSAGTTTYTVGDIQYNIRVSYRQEEVTLIVDGTATRTVSGTLNKTGLDEGIATVSVSGGVMTIHGISAGDTSVIVGNTQYTIHVINEDLSSVNPLSIEYWITNAKLTHNGSQSLSLAAAAQGVNSEEGIAADKLLLPESISHEGRSVWYWHCRLLDKTKVNSSTSGKEEQTTAGGDDETQSGAVFTRVRYLNGQWQVFTDAWAAVEAKHQLVAYYLEKAEISQEIDAYMADYGKKGDGSMTNPWLAYLKAVTLSVQVVYEDGSTNPPSKSATDMRSKTLVLNAWENGHRGVGTVMFAETGDYEIYRVTAETGTFTGTSTDPYDTYTVDSFTWSDNPQTVWEGESENGWVAISNNSRSPETTGIYENLYWPENENGNSILLRVYVRAKVTEDALTVHYCDRTAGDAEFYNYGIVVNSGTVFSPDFALQDSQLTGNTVTNSLGVTQTVSMDLKSMPAIGAQYRYSEFTCVEVSRSADGKDVYLYYTFNNIHRFVVDFGLPLTIHPSDLNANLAGATVSSIVVTGAKYGTIDTVTGTDPSFTYTPNRIMTETEILNVEVVGGTGSQVTYRVYLIPATTVLYDSRFIEFDTGSWTSVVTGIPSAQTTEKLGTKQNVYGYDSAYNRAGSFGYHTSTTIGAKGSFSFKGTGVSIYTNNTEGTGRMSVQIRKQSDNSLVKLYAIDTSMKNGTTGFTAGQTVNDKNFPSLSVTDLAYDSYIVKISHVKASSETERPLNISAVRIYNTLGTAGDTLYTEDTEQSPYYYTLRNAALYAYGVTSVPASESEYIGESANGKQYLEQVYSPEENGSNQIALVGKSLTQSDVTDMLNNGPKNQLYLRAGESVAFTINGEFSSAQIGLKAVGGTASVSINGETRNIESVTDMFYSLGAPTSGSISVTIENSNNSAAILAITDLKTIGAAATLAQPETRTLVASARSIMLMNEQAEEPSVPEEPSKEQAKLTIVIRDIFGREIASRTISAEGPAGDTHTFTKKEIQTAAKALASESGCRLSAFNSYKDTKVEFGSEKNVYVSSLTIKRSSLPLPF